MSGSIGRSYLIQSWNDASSYSGEQIGNRLKVSTDLYLANGKANIGLFEEKPASKPKKSVADSIDLAQRHYDRIEQMSIDLDSEYFAGEIDEERYQLLRYKMDERLAKAWKRLEKENTPVWNKLEAIEEINREAAKSLAKSMEKSLTGGEGWLTIAFKDCKEDNVFKQAFLFVMRIIKTWKSLKEGD